MTRPIKVCAVDFDGVIVEDRYPDIGTLMPNALEGLEKLSEQYEIIIWTCRVGERLREVIWILKELGVKYYAINTNHTFKVDKYGSDTRKLSADLYIDDKNFGGFPGWKAVMDWLEKQEGGI